MDSQTLYGPLNRGYDLPHIVWPLVGVIHSNKFCGPSNWGDAFPHIVLPL